MFEPIPAVDIRGGRCVRLLQGDYARETVYGHDPVEMAKRWEAEGASRLHVVDLDGAKDGTRVNAAVIRKMTKAVRIPVQVGGGIRSLETAREVLDDGAARVAFGTAAVEQLEQLGGWVEALGSDRVVVGVDARGNHVVTRGWLQETEHELVAFTRLLAEQGVKRIFYTDVGRDGLMGGPNLTGIRALVRESGMAVIASGGVTTQQDIRNLAHAGAEGAIIGKALYEGMLTLKDAQRAAREATQNR